MKQGIDPATHKPLSEVDEKEKINCTEKDSNLPNIPQPQGLSAASMASQGPAFLGTDSSYYEGGGGLTEASKEQFMNKQAFDSLSYYEFQMGLETWGYNSDLVVQYQNSIRPSSSFNQNQNYDTNSNFGFSSMPSLANSDHGNMSGTDFSDNSASRVSSCFFMNNEVKESSSNSSNVSNYAGYQMNSSNNNNNIVENNAAAFSWDSETKLESLFQFQVNGIKSEEFMKPSSWQEGHLHVQNSVDFSSSYPLTSLSEDLTGANFDVFQHI